MRLLIALLLVSVVSLFAKAEDINHDELFFKLAPLANTGDSEAQYYIGMMYHLGLGTEKNYLKAYEMFRKSNLAGHPLSAYKIGCYYAGQGDGTLPPDEERALEFKLKAAEAGYSFAQYDISQIYGRIDEPDRQLSWLKKSANQGYPYALLMLSFKYNMGFGVEPNPMLAYSYLLLGMRSMGGPLNEEAVKVLQDLKQIMTARDIERANEFVLDFSPVRSALTIKAQRGLIPANKHVSSLIRQD